MRRAQQRDRCTSCRLSFDKIALSTDFLSWVSVSYQSVVGCDVRHVSL
jgi:hypothetical protein